MSKPFTVFTANSREDFWRKCIVIGKVAEERLGNQYTIPVAEHERELMTLYQPDAGTEKYLVAIRPDEQHPSEFFISWHSGDSKTLADFRKSRKQIPYMSVPIQPKPGTRPPTVSSQRSQKVSQKPASPKPAEKPASPKRDIHPPRYYSPDIPQPKPKPGTVPQPKPGAKPVAKVAPKPAAKPVAVPQPKPVAKQPAANPHRRARVLQDDDDDDSDDDRRIFDPQHPLQHPRDDDRPLPYLIGKPYSYIKRTINNKSDALAFVISHRGCSVNEGNRIRTEQDKERRQRKAYDRDVERTYQQLRREILAIGEKQQRALQKVDAFADKIGLGQEQQQQQ